MNSTLETPAVSFWDQRQAAATEAATRMLLKHKRTQLHWFCGTGKTRLGVLTADRVGARRICVVAPSLALVYGQMQTWQIERPDSVMHAFCSDLASEDEQLVSTLDREAMRAFLSRSDFIVFTTYHSLQELASLVTAPFDLLIMDEAHSTCGKKGRAFGAGLDPLFPVRMRLSLTATPKYLGDAAGRDDYSMCDTTVYGPVADRLGYREAQSNGLLCDYRVLISDLGASVGADDEQRLWRMATEMLSLMKEYGLSRAISSHSRVADAQAFQRILRSLDSLLSVFHVNGEMSAARQLREIASFRTATRSVITHVQCLCQGIDVPAVDLVFFADPKHTDIGIVQTIGRALRRDPLNPGKVAYIALPMHGYSAPEYGKLRHVLRTLTFADLRVEEWFARHEGKAREVTDEDMPAWIRVRSVDAAKWRKVLSRKRSRGRILDRIDPKGFANAVQLHLSGGASFGGPDGPDYRKAWYGLENEAVRSFPREPMDSPVLRAVLKVPQARVSLGMNADPLIEDAMLARGVCFSSLSRLTGIVVDRLAAIAFHPCRCVSLLECSLVEEVLGEGCLKPRAFSVAPPLGHAADGKAVARWQNQFVEAYEWSLDPDYAYGHTLGERDAFMRAIEEGALEERVLQQARAYWLHRYAAHGNIDLHARRKEFGLYPGASILAYGNDHHFARILSCLPSLPAFREPVPELLPEWIPGGPLASETLSIAAEQVATDGEGMDGGSPQVLAPAIRLMSQILGGALEQGARGAWELAALFDFMAYSPYWRTVSARHDNDSIEFHLFWRGLPALYLASLGINPNDWDQAKEQAKETLAVLGGKCTAFLRLNGTVPDDDSASDQFVAQVLAKMNVNAPAILSVQVPSQPARDALLNGSFRALLIERCDRLHALLHWGKLHPYPVETYPTEPPSLGISPSDVERTLERAFVGQKFSLPPGIPSGYGLTRTPARKEEERLFVTSATAAVPVGDLEINLQGKPDSHRGYKWLMRDEPNFVFVLEQCGDDWRVAGPEGKTDTIRCDLADAVANKGVVSLTLRWLRPLGALRCPKWRAKNL